MMKTVLISMDCVRSDYLGQPSFRPLIEEGFLFPTCITSASHTSTSHTTMLTGTYPFHHGVRWLVRYKVKDRMIQEVLGSNGFRTGAFIGGFPLTQGDLHRGFDIFQHEPLVEDRYEGRSHFVPSNILVQQAADMLNSSEDDAFAFIHMFDAHLTLRSEFDTAHPPPPKGDDGRYIDIESHLGRRERRYRQEIDLMGAQVKRLTEIADIDLLVVTADHGEKMQGEKGYPWVYNHKGEPVGSHFHEVELFEQQLKVPLLFWGKDIAHGNDDRMVRTIDIAPTMLEHSGLDTDDIKQDGSSLLPSIREKAPPDARFAYSETYFAQMHAENLHAKDMSRKFSWGWNRIDNLVSLRTNDQKLICLANGELVPCHFYDLASDPGEKRDLVNSPSHSDQMDELFNVLYEMVKGDPQYLLGTKEEEGGRIKSIARRFSPHRKL
jgi:arylsulfatase A-like enzyme